ncbi:hypothetical protein NQ317_003390 [Molorchus minor]|uniref:Uncharacterized protein n=1 Tax=Molorchus minor TaxID=1323400 RepID=A0ABQ9K677_9CUCU|nr:hypothetical protein NQ317_003390 [Molorchus minor]
MAQLTVEKKRGTTLPLATSLEWVEMRREIKGRQRLADFIVRCLSRNVLFLTIQLSVTDWGTVNSSAAPKLLEKMCLWSPHRVSVHSRRVHKEKWTSVFLFAQVVSICSASAAPEEWAAASPFSHFTAEDSRADTFTSAYLNVSFLTEDGWKWDKTDVGRYGGGYIVLRKCKNWVKDNITSGEDPISLATLHTSHLKGQGHSSKLVDIKGILLCIFLLYATDFLGPLFGELVHVTSRLRPEDHTGCTWPFESSRSDGKLPPPRNSLDRPDQEGPMQLRSQGGERLQEQCRGCASL